MKVAYQHRLKRNAVQLRERIARVQLMRDKGIFSGKVMLMRNLHLNDLSIIETRRENINIIGTIARNAGRSAAERAAVAGLPKVFVRDGHVIRSSGDGQQEEVISAASTVTANAYFVYTKPGILHARKK